MKTEFNVKRICDRVHLCVVDAPDLLGAPAFQIRNGSLYVSFPGISAELAKSIDHIGEPEVKDVPALKKPSRKK